MSSEIVIEGYGRVRGKVEWLVKGAPSDSDRVMGARRERTEKKLSSKPYAPPPPNSTYRRTGKLGRAWSSRRQALLEHAFINSSGYASYVIGRGQQARIHRGRWWEAETAVEDEIPPLLDDVVELYERVWAS